MAGDFDKDHKHLRTVSRTSGCFSDFFGILGEPFSFTMQWLKRLPIGYTARLSDIKLINFAIDAEELNSFLPRLPLVRIDGNPVISLLDVKLYRLRPSFLLNPFHFTYRHIAFRLLVKDDHLHDDHVNRGFFYMYSFTNSQWVARLGRVFTNFNFETACITGEENTLSLNHRNKYLGYSVDTGMSAEENSELKQSLMHIDRAYSLNENKLKVTKVKRSNLPLQNIHCSQFETNFFRSTKIIGAFCVQEVLSYQWLPSQNCEVPSLIAAAGA